MSDFPCLDILADIRDPGYPPEYLYSRLRGRRSRMVTDWRALAQELSFTQAGSPQQRNMAEGLPAMTWRGLLREHRWVFGRMSGGMRKVFAPYFLYAEIRTICICLRGKPERKAEQVGDLLAASLLADRLKSAFLDGRDQEAALLAVEAALVHISPGLEGLVVLAEREGLRSVEQRMTNEFLASAARAGLHPLLRSFFRRVIDARNILSLYKTFKLEDPASPPFIPGGSMAQERFADILKRGDLPDVMELVRRLTGQRIDLKDASRMEAALYRSMTREFRTAGRDPLDAGLVLDYLWRRSIEAMNRSMLAYTKDLDRETVLAELVH